MDNKDKHANELLDDYDRILADLFAGAQYNKQPRYLVALGAGAATLLQHTHELVQRQTDRGKRLVDYPLELVAIVESETERAALAKLSCRACVATNITAAGISSCLADLDVLDVAHCLFVNTSGDPAWSLSAIAGPELDRSHGYVIVQDYEAANKHLRSAARAGYFPSVGGSYSYPKQADVAVLTLNHFRKRNYCVRDAELDDLSKLMEIEHACWPGPLRQTPEVITARIEDTSWPSLVVDSDDGIIAVVYAQRISSIELLQTAQATAVDQLRDPNGAVLQLIALNIMPGKELAELEGHLLEFFLQAGLTTDHVTEVCAVLRCENYPGDDVISFTSYVEELKIGHGSADLATRLHVKHGAEIRGCIENYRVSDTINLGQGALVVYTRGAREPRLAAGSSEAQYRSSTEYTPESIGTKVDERVKAYASSKEYSRTSTWTELGLTTTHQLELRADLSNTFAIDLPSNFLAQSGNPDSVIRHLIESKIHTYKDWLYEIQWCSTAKPGPQALQPGGRWLIFTDGEDLGTAVRERLHELGQTCTVVESGSSFEKQTDQHYVLDASNPASVKQLFLELPDLGEFVAVVYLWGYSNHTAWTTETLNQQHQHSISGLFEIANELMLSGQASSPRLWVVTQSIPQDGSDASLAEWPLCGLCKVLRDEYPKLRTTYLALDWEVSASEAGDALIDELRADPIERQIAFRRGERLTPRMLRLHPEGVKLPTLSPKARYLIIGGLRPLGLLLARWHVARGAKRLILAGELELTAEAKIAIAELQEQGVEVLTPQLDFEALDSFTEMLDHISKDGIPLKGAMHAAGMVDNDLLMRMTWERFQAVHHLKVSASWNLHKATENLDLDHFILFSSCLPDLAPLGKANHATGNSFVDALAHYRQKRGLAALAIDCGPWDLRHVEIRRLEEMSVSGVVDVLQVEEGLQLLEHLYYQTCPQITAAHIQWPQLLQGSDDSDPLFDEIAIELGYKRVPLLQLYTSVAPEKRLEAVADYLHETTRRLLSLPSGSVLESGLSFTKLGLDLATQQQLRKRIKFDLDDAAPIPLDLLEAHPNLEALTAALHDLLSQAASSDLQEAVAIVKKSADGYTLTLLDENVENLVLEPLSEKTPEQITELSKQATAWIFYGPKQR